jgi:hypothetical protein
MKIYMFFIKYIINILLNNLFFLIIIFIKTESIYISTIKLYLVNEYKAKNNKNTIKY